MSADSYASLLTPETLAAPESDFQRGLQERMTATGQIGDVFGAMVTRNVPCLVLATFWPHYWEKYRRAPRPMMFAAAEAGWANRISSLRASVVPHAPGSYLVRFEKNYVIECERLIVLARPAARSASADDVVLDEARVALVYLERNASQRWTRRTEAELTLPRSGGAPPVEHYVVRGEEVVDAERVLILNKDAYARVAVQLPRREITSLALLSLALLRHLGYQIPPEQTRVETALLTARDGTRLSGRAMDDARTLLGYFFEAAARDGLVLHPLWERMRAMAAQA